MPILPLDHPEPLAATLGVLLYPGEDDADRRRARAFAAHFLAEPIRMLHESGGSLTYEELARVASDAGARLDDLEERWWGGTATGEIFKMFFALAHTEPRLASWANATRVTERVAARHGAPGSRSALYSARRRFRSVAHLWAAWCIRDRTVRSDPEVGYEGWHDFQFFLAEAEILRDWGQAWQPERAKATPPLPAEVWRVPEGWEPPQPQPGWPPTGQIPVLTVPTDLLAGLRRAGRPKGTG